MQAKETNEGEGIAMGKELESRRSKKEGKETKDSTRRLNRQSTAMRKRTV